MKEVDSTQQFQELKNAILDAREKYVRLNFRNKLVVCLAEFLRLSKLMVDLQNMELKNWLYIL